MLSIFSKLKTEHKLLVRALKARPLEPTAMAALNDVLRTDHGTMDEDLLFTVVHDSEKALLESHDEMLLALLTEIHRSANWEIQSRYKAT